MKEIDVKNKDLWDKIVRENNGTAFHLWDWLKLMEKHSEHAIIKKSRPKLLPLMVVQGQEPVGIFPIFLFRNPNFIFSPPPHSESFYLGPIFSGLDGLKQHKKEKYLLNFYKEIDNYIQKFNPEGIKIKTLPNFIDQRQLKWLGYELEPLYDYLINLKLEDEILWKGLEKSVRKKIRKAKKDGLFIEESGRDGLEFIYNSINERFKEQGEQLLYSKEYLLDVFNTFPEIIKIFIAKYNGRPCGGSINICFNNEVLGWVGASKSKIDTINPNELLIWETIMWGKKAGYEKFRISWANNARLNKYKSQYNPELEIYFSASKFSPLFSLLHGIKNRLKKEVE